jgi:predicted nucleic acid-binding protein
MLYILDTDVLSNLRKEKRHPAVVHWVQRTGWAQLSTTVINIAEIQCGIERQMLSHPTYANGTKAWMDRLLQDGSPSVWPLDLPAALTFARMHESAALRNFVLPDRNQKRPKTTGDLAVAAIAIARDAVIATRNVKHFGEIHSVFRLPGVFDPFAEAWAVEPT